MSHLRHSLATLLETHVPLLSHDRNIVLSCIKACADIMGFFHTYGTTVIAFFMLFCFFYGLQKLGKWADSCERLGTCERWPCTVTPMQTWPQLLISYTALSGWEIQVQHHMFYRLTRKWLEFRFSLDATVYSWAICSVRAKSGQIKFFGFKGGIMTHGKLFKKQKLRYFFLQSSQKDNTFKHP